MKKILELKSITDTESLGVKLGSLLRGGECFEFLSDLGGGKTTFIRSLVSGAGSDDNVSSPTFTISKQYKSNIGRFYHFDFYRLQEPGLIAEDLVESLEDDTGIVLIEWGQTVRGVLPVQRIIIEFTKKPDNLEGRKMTIDIPDKFSYLDKAFR